VLLATAACLMVGAILLFLQIKKKNAAADHVPAPIPDQAQAPPRRGALARMAPRRQNNDADENNADEADDDDDDDDGEDAPKKRVGAKKAAKLQMKEQKKKQREAGTGS